MKDQEKEETQEEEKKKKEGKMPFCTTAPSAEHARADDEDEPCDDSRAGK
ncbi:MAG: hypothetical protein V1758_03000 [Pseudomonadota bacterium]